MKNIDLKNTNIEKKEKPQKKLNLRLLSQDLIQFVKQKTGQNLRYGTITFTYHNGACVHVDSSVTRRVPLKKTNPVPQTIPMKLVRDK